MAMNANDTFLKCSIKMSIVDWKYPVWCCCCCCCDDNKIKMARKKYPVYTRYHEIFQHQHTIDQLCADVNQSILTFFSSNFCKSWMQYKGENTKSIISQNLRIAQKIISAKNDCQIDPDLSCNFSHFWRNISFLCIFYNLLDAKN